MNDLYYLAIDKRYEVIGFGTAILLAKQGTLRGYVPIYRILLSNRLLGHRN